MNLFKRLSILILISFTACSNDGEANISEGSCQENEIEQSISIMDGAGVTQLCLMTDIEQKVISWNWSEDGTMFAFAVHDTSVTRPALSGKYGGYSPPATNWYISKRDGSDLQRFSLADNKVLRFSPDGKYAIIRENCFDLFCTFSIYKVQGQRKICGYKTYSLWFWESDCGRLTFKTGDTWDLRGEVNDVGCDYYRKEGAAVTGCATATPEFYPAPRVTPSQASVSAGYPSESR